MKKHLLLTLLFALSNLTALSQTPPPTGFSEQRFCYFENPKVSDISVTGSNIKWYDAASGGNLIPSTNDIIDYKDYFASQTISGLESTTRLKVFIRKEMYPMILGYTTFCEGGSVDLIIPINYPSNQSEMMYSFNYQWNKDGQSIMNNNGGQIYTATQSGSYSVRQNTNWMNSTNGTMHNCSSESNPIQITVNPNPTATITPVGSTTISTGGSVVLNASTGTGYTYQWFKDGTSITSATTSSYTATQSGSYTVKVSNSSTTCNATSTPTVVAVNSTTTPTATITAGGSTTFCQGSSVILNATTGGGFTYEWYKDGSIISGATLSSFTATQSGNYTVKVINGVANATSLATVVVVNPIPVLTNFSTTTICSNSNIYLTLTSNIPSSFIWNAIDNPSVSGESITNQTSGTINDFLINFTSQPQNLIYNVIPTSTSGGCQGNIQTVSVTVNSLPNITNVLNKVICSGQSVNLSLTSDVPATFSWQASDNSNVIGENLTYQTSPIMNDVLINNTSVPQVVNYTLFSSSIPGNCVGNQNLIITVNPNPTATITAGGSTTFCLGGSVILNASIGSGYTYVWYKNGTVINSSTTSSYIANQSGSYTVKVINGNCNATSLVKDVLVNTNPTVSLNTVNSVVYKTSSAIQLVGNPSGGIYSGETVSGSIFTPANATLGKKTISYKYTNPQGCSSSATQTTIVADTVGNVCSTYDTLKIKVHFTAGLYANTTNMIKFYPNPTKDILFIDNGNYQAMNGYSIKIVSLIGSVVYKQPITSQQVQISMNQFGAKGLYIAQIIDPNNSIVDSKKIVLE